MIKYDGVKTINKIPHILFSNDQGGTVVIPIDASTAHRITAYLAKIAPGNYVSPIERGNDEPSDPT